MNASNDEEFTVSVTRQKLAYDAVAHLRTSGPMRQSASPLHSNADDVRATWQRVPGRLDRIDPARAGEALRKTSIDDRARALLALVAAGDQRAYEALYPLLSRRVYAFALRMTFNAETADEIMVDTMYEVWRTAGRFRGGSLVSTWVLGIARNKALMAMRSNPRSAHEDIDDLADVLEGEAPDGFALLAQKQARELMRDCLQGLSAKHRECLHLTYFEDLTIREIAVLVGVPDGTVKSRLFQARALLAVRLSAMVHEAAATRDKSRRPALKVHGEKALARGMVQKEQALG